MEICGAEIQIKLQKLNSSIVPNGMNVNLSTVSNSSVLTHSLPPPRRTFPGQQQRSGVPAVSRPSEGVAGPAGGPGAAGPCTLPPRERPLQPDHYVRAGVVSQHPEEAGSAGGRGLPGGGQLQHTVPQTGVGGKTMNWERTHTAAFSSSEATKPLRVESVGGWKALAPMRECGDRKVNVECSVSFFGSFRTGFILTKWMWEAEPGYTFFFVSACRGHGNDSHI